MGPTVVWLDTHKVGGGLGIGKGPGKDSRVGSVGGGALARGHRDPMK